MGAARPLNGQPLSAARGRARAEVARAGPAAAGLDRGARRHLEAELGQGAGDAQVFAYAIQHGYVVLSSDERALWRPRRYREQGEAFPGMLCWPQRHRDRMTVGEAVEAVERLALEDDPFGYGYRFIKPQA